MAFWYTWSALTASPVKAGLEALNAAQRLAAQQGGKPVAAVLLDSADAAAEVGAYGALQRS